MLKLLKYEFKENLKDIIGMFLILIILFVFCWIGIYNDYRTFSVVAAILTAVSVMITMVIISISLFTKELKNKTRNLKYTLPVDPAKIVASKIIFSYLLMLIYCILAFTFLISIFTNIRVGLNQTIVDLAGYLGLKGAAFLIISGSAEFIFLLALIYFSIAFTRIPIKNNRLSLFFAIPVFLVLQNIISLISLFIKKYIPANFNLGVKVFLNISMKSTDDGLIGSLVPKFASINIVNLVFSAAVFIALLWGTTYIMRRKADI